MQLKAYTGQSSGTSPGQDDMFNAAPTAHIVASSVHSFTGLNTAVHPLLHDCSKLGSKKRQYATEENEANT